MRCWVRVVGQVTLMAPVGGLSGFFEEKPEGDDDSAVREHEAEGEAKRQGKPVSAVKPAG